MSEHETNPRIIQRSSDHTNLPNLDTKKDPHVEVIYHDPEKDRHGKWVIFLRPAGYPLEAVDKLRILVEYNPELGDAVSLIYDHTIDFSKIRGQ